LRPSLGDSTRYGTVKPRRLPDLRESKDFQNYVEAAPWGDSRHADRSGEAGKEVMALNNSTGQDDDEE